jgi:hypothetical protein
MIFSDTPTMMMVKDYYYYIIRVGEVWTPHAVLTYTSEEVKGKEYRQVSSLVNSDES